MTRKLVIGVVTLAIGLGFALTVQADDNSCFDITMQELMADAEKTDFLPAIVVMSDRHDLQGLRQLVKGMPRQERKSVVWEEIKAFADDSQEDLLKTLEWEKSRGRVRFIRSLKLINAVYIEAHPGLIEQVAGRQDIRKIIGDPPRQVFPPRFNGEAGNGELDEVTWSVEQINAPDVWDDGWTGEDVLIAIIDTGADYNHGDLSDHLWNGGIEFPNHGYDIGDDDNDPMDTHGHGTHVAGIAVGDGTGGTETGVAPDATLMILKTSILTDYAAQQAVFACHDFALEHGADVTSMSLGWIDAWTPARDEFRDSFDGLDAAGIANVVAAGNEAAQGCRTPGDVPSPWRHPDQVAEGTTSGVITAGASNQAGDIAGFSSRGPDEWEDVDPYNDYPSADGGLILPDVVAPGVDVTSLQRGGGYWSQDGTSMAAPSVAGTICLMLSKSPELIPADIDSILQVTADDRGAEGKDNTWGSGFIDAYEAVDAALAVLGFLEGTVTDANTDEPLEDIEVCLTERNYSTVTDENGFYFMEIVRGIYTITVNHEPYVYYENGGVQIDSAETTVVDIELQIGIVSVDPETLSVTLQNRDAQDHILTFSNLGTAVINVDLVMEPQFEIDDSMDVVQELNLTDITGDGWINGMVYGDGVFYVAGANNWSNPNYIYKFNFNGQYLGSFEQPGSGLPSANQQGMRDLAYDGTYLYGGVENQIIVMDASSGRETRRFAGPYNPNQAMVYDPDWDLLWVTSNLRDIVGISRWNGEELYRIPNELFVDALAYWPNERVEYTIYMSAREQNETRRNLYKVDADEQDIQWVAELPDYEGANAILKGLAIIQRYNVYFNAIACLMTTTDWGCIVVRELNMEIPYATFSPNRFIIMPHGDYEVTVTLLTGGLGDGNYRSDLIATHNTAIGETIIPIMLTIELGVTEETSKEVLPASYALHKPYPNPFNSASVIRFDLPREELVKIAVYDVLGREVATLHQKTLIAGRYSVAFDGSNFSSGIYFVRMQAGGDYSQTVKMVLIK